MSDEWECDSCSSVFALETEYDLHLETAHKEE
jgi:hypothetical protein